MDEEMPAETMKTIPELLQIQADRLGDRIAFHDSNRAVGYRELERRTWRIAGHLGARWVTPRSRVAIFVGNRVDVAECYFAIARAGAVAVPLNPMCSDSDLAYFLEDSACRVLVTDRARLAQVRRIVDTARVTVLLVGDTRVPEDTYSFAALAQKEPDAPARDDLSLDETAWIFYSSGTTGRPKGVLSTQRNYLWACGGFVDILGLSQEDRILVPLPLFHCFGFTLGVVGILLTGATAHVLEEFDADQYLSIMREGTYTCLTGVPTMFHRLINSAVSSDAKVSGARICVVAGASSSAALRDDWEKTFGSPLVDAYGATETGGLIAVNWPKENRQGTSCGRPLSGLSVRLVDPSSGVDVTSDREGEVWVAGPGVMAGYLNRPEETATALVDGWYRTGDLARRDEAGLITLTGRLKEVISRGGEKFHPGQVEEVIAAIPGVLDVAVAGKEHEELGQIPVAFVVPRDNGIDVSDIFAQCREHLVAYMVPEEIYAVDVIPRTGAGKVIRRTLLSSPGRLLGVADSPTRVRRSAHPAKNADTSEFHRQLADVPESARGEFLTNVVCTEAAAVFAVESPTEIDPDLTFSDIGLSSAGGVHLRDRLTARTGVVLPATVMFDYPTPAALAAYVHSVLIPGAPVQKPGNELSDEAVRQLLNTVPIDLLRAAGLLDEILALTEAGRAGQSAPAADTGAEPWTGTIDAMDAEELIRMVRDGGDEGPSTT